MQDQGNILRDRDWIEKLIQSTKGIQESYQRSLKVIAELKNREPNQIAKFLRELEEASTHHKDPMSRIHLDLLHNRDLLFELGYETLLSVYQYAFENGWATIQALLRSDRFMEGKDEPMPEVVARKLSSLTLGERKQLSRNMKRKNIEILIWDSHQMVIQELLKNPRIVEQDVVRIASRHQAPPEILEEICKSERWITHYNVKKAIVFNPRTPLSIALSLTNHLRQVDLHTLINGGSSRKELVELAKQNLEKN